MKRPSLLPRFRLLAGILLMGAPSVLALAEEQSRQEPPDFTTYRPPTPFLPQPRAEWFGYLDAAMLVVFLSLTAWFALKKRSRRDVRTLSIFGLLYFGFYRGGCICSVGGIQNVALALGNSGYALPLTAGAFFLLPLLFALFFGRVFCAAACPLGAIQDLVLQWPKRIPAWLDGALGTLPYLYLGAAVLFAATGSAFVICDYDPFIAFFRLGGKTEIVALGAALLLVGTVYGRPYCRFLCPYGVLLRWLAPFARWQVSVYGASQCVRCHLCADSCPFDALRFPTPEEHPVDRGKERRRMTVLVLLLPILVSLSAWLGYRSGPALSRVHPTVALADRIWREERGKAKGTTEASDAFRKLGKSNESLYREALEIRRKFDAGSLLFGGWVGLTIGMRLLLLSMRRRRETYEADPAACLSCARCYETCPVDRSGFLAPEALDAEMLTEARG